MTRRRVLVTGATGFVGGHLVRGLVEGGWDVSAIVHRRSGDGILGLDRVRIVQGDIGDASTISAAIVDADAVCHAAAFVPPDHDDPAYAEPCLQTNAVGTLRLAEAALRRPGCRFVYLAAGTAYASADDLATETTPLYPADRATYYLTSKIAGELFVEHLRRVRRLASVSLRVSSIYGPGMPATSIVARFMTAARARRPLEVWHAGVPTYDFVYVSDVVGAALAALDSGEPGVYNVGSGRAHTLLSLAECVAATFGDLDVKIQVRPATGAIPGSFPVLAIDKAKKVWQFSPRTLAEGLAAYRDVLEDGR